MKALSIQQPWAWAILHLGKVENRDWETAHRGPLLIHAGKAFSKAEWAARVRVIEHVSGRKVPPPEKLGFGGIVGQVNMVACVWRPKGAPLTGFSRWHERGSYGYYFDDQHPMPLLPFKGQLKLFEVDDNLIRRHCARR